MHMCALARESSPAIYLVSWERPFLQTACVLETFTVGTNYASRVGTNCDTHPDSSSERILRWLTADTLREAKSCRKRANREPEFNSVQLGLTLQMYTEQVAETV